MIAAVEAASKRFSPKGEKLRKSLSRSGSGLYWIFGVAQCVDQDVPSKRLSYRSESGGKFNMEINRE